MELAHKLIFYASCLYRLLHLNKEALQPIHHLNTQQFLGGKMPFCMWSHLVNPHNCGALLCLEFKKKEKKGKLFHGEVCKDYKQKEYKFNST